MIKENETDKLIVEKTYNYDNNYYDLGIGGFHKASIPYIHSHFLSLDAESTHGRTLDFGCGNGFHAAFLKSMATSLDGVDYSDAIQTSPNKQYYSSIFKADLSEKKLEIPKGQYDLLFSIEVIEHVKDYRAFLNNANDLLKPGGKIFLTTTTYFWSIFILLVVYRKSITLKKLYEFFRGWLGSEKYKTRFVMHFWDFFTGHYHGFSKRQIIAGFRSQNFQILKVKYLPIQDVILMDYLRIPYNGKFKTVVRAILPFIRMIATSINFICKKFRIYSPNILVIAQKK